MIDLFSLRNPLNARESRMVITVAIAALVALLYVNVIEPRYIEWKELESQISEAKAEYGELSVLMEHEDEINDYYELLSKKTNSSGTEAADNITFYKSLCDMESSSNLRFLDIRPTHTNSQGDDFQESSAVIICEGQVSALEDFLQRVADAEEVLRVEKLTLTIPAANSLAKIQMWVSRQVRREP